MIGDHGGIRTRSEHRALGSPDSAGPVRWTFRPCTYGSRSAKIAASIGPGIGSYCYRVEEDRYLEFPGRFGPNSIRKQEETFFLDLAAANVELLARCGVGEIRVCRNCTACTPQLSSFRRDGSAFAHMLACIGELEDD